MTTRRCYIARYPLNARGDDLNEEILHRDTYWSRDIEAAWDRLIAERIARIPAGQQLSSEPQLQAWYADNESVTCMAQTNQPFALN